MLVRNVAVKIVLADSDRASRRYTSHAIGLDERLQIVLQVEDATHLYKAVCATSGCIVLIASTLMPNPLRLRMMLEATRSQGIIMAEHGETPNTYLRLGFEGVFFRNSCSQTVRDCIHRVASDRSGTEPHWKQLNTLVSRPMDAGASEGVTSGGRQHRRLIPLMPRCGSAWTALETLTQLPARAAS